jgi:hypothetical protein
MRKIALSLVLATLGTAGLAPAAFTQTLPTAQPKFLTLIRERVKLGRAADHAKHEAGWPVAYEKAKSTQAYVALASMTGPPEVWYLTPFESHAALDEVTRREEADPVLSGELERLQRADAEFVSDIQFMQAAARPDLSHGAFPDISKVRFYEITEFHVKPGHESGFAAVAKVYAAMAAKAAPKASWRTYQVMAGAPSGTFFVLSSLESYGEFDQSIADGMKMMGSLSAEDAISLQKFDAEGLERPAETNRYRLDPGQSYVAREVREKDAAFWMPKKTLGTAKVPAKKPAQP